MFDRIAAIVLRDIADLQLELDLAKSLRHIADRLEADAGAMDPHLPPMPPTTITSAVDQGQFFGACRIGDRLRQRATELAPENETVG
jgi:hypothetical protein